MTTAAASTFRSVANRVTHAVQATCMSVALVAGINFPINAQRKTWTQIRGHLVTACGMTLPQ